MAVGAENSRQVIMADVCNRYQADVSLETSSKTNWVLKCETELAEYFGKRNGLAVSSGGLAITLGLQAMHRVLLHGTEKSNVKVYSNSFTFSAVPSAIITAGFEPTFIETSEALTIDVDDFERKVKSDLEKGAAAGGMVLVLSYMRGRIPDMDRVLEVCKAFDVKILEDNAHGYGAAWKGRKTGNFGLVSTISTQANKLINTGEGGFAFTDDDHMHAFMMIAAGCYEELFKKHGPMCPSAEAIEAMRYSVPNVSCRMSNILAAVAHPQIAMLTSRITAHNSNYAQLEALVGQKLAEALKADDRRFQQPAQKLIQFIPQLSSVEPVFDSLQLRITCLTPTGLELMIKNMVADGFKVQLFAVEENARYYRSWRYCVSSGTQLFQTEKNLEGVIDMRLLAHDTDADVEKQASGIVERFLDAREKDLLDIESDSTRSE
jgi:dTDP-4-amino-4,6-dideoxygalactose transaminase